MRVQWHPLSAVLLDDPRCFATPYLLRMMLGSGVDVRYAGDRCWPAVKDGQVVRAAPPTDPPSVGDLVLASCDGIVELARVVDVGPESFGLIGDADPDPPLVIPRDQLLACIPGHRADPPDERLRRRRRRRLDLIEAMHHGPDAAQDAAATVLDKYDFQAPQYARDPSTALPEAVRGRLETGAADEDRRVLIVGSGSGSECFDLAARGWTVTGIDFSPQMVRLAREEAARRGLDVTFVEGDVRHAPFEPGGFAVAVTTFDVYSFLPSANDRVEALGRLSRSIAAGGSLFVSARLIDDPYARSLAGKFRRGRPWGASHTRWIDGAGTVRRSFVQLFTRESIAGEFEAAGLQAGPWFSGYTELRRENP